MSKIDENSIHTVNDIPTIECDELPTMDVSIDIYNNGDECLDLTGGWKWSTWNGSPTFTKQGTNLKIICPQWSDGCIKPVNIPTLDDLNWDAISHIEVEYGVHSIGGGYARLKVADIDIVYQDRINITSPAKVEYTGGDIEVVVANTSSGSSGYFTITRITLHGKKIIINGGLPKQFKGSFDSESGHITLNWLKPDETLASRICLVKSREHIPTNIDDGDIVFDSEDVTISEFIDTSIRKNATYYYTLFTFDNNGEIVEDFTSTSVIAAGKLQVRYIRDWLNGSTSNGGNHWVEIEAYSNGTNVARGKTVSMSPNSTDSGGSGNLTWVTDGDTNTANYFERPRPTGEVQWVQVDLGELYDIEKVNIRHYSQDSRKYYQTKTEISPDGNAWYVIFDSDKEGIYTETSSGKTHVFNILDNVLPNYYDEIPTYMVQNLSAHYDGYMTTLVWDPPTDDNVTGLVIRRCEDRLPIDANDGTLVFDTNNPAITTFSDKRIKKHRDYYYMVYTHNADGEFFTGTHINVYTIEMKYQFPKTFTSCNARANIGPTDEQVKSYYAENGNLKDLVQSSKGYQMWTVPKHGVYNIKAIGASGGCGSDYGASGGGRGASISADVSLKQGDKLIIVVGQKGEDAPGDSDGGGGGGTFVVKVVPQDDDNQNIVHLPIFDCYVEPIIIAGGGGAVSADSTGHDASLSENSTRSNSATAIGEGAKHGDGSGGGGYKSNGKDGYNNSYGGKGFVNGSQGGNSNRKGGFGGGGGGNDEYGAGGGGYTGAPGYDGPSGGGGSFVTENATNVTKVIHDKRENGCVVINAVDIDLGGYLMINNDGEVLYYNVDLETWETIGNNITVDDIEAYAMTTLPYQLTKLVDGSTIIKCVDRVTPTIDYNVVALPLSCVIKQTVDIDISDKLIVGLNIDATNEVQILASVDSGETYQYYNGNEWVEYNNDLVGMSIETAGSLSRNVWKKINYEDVVRFAFIIKSTDYIDTRKVKSIAIKTIYK